MNRQIIEQIINFGCLAPSGDNSQPWRFVVEKNVIKVFMLRNKDNYILNVDHSGTLLACGALVENISIAAAEYGIYAAIEYGNNSTDEDLIANITLNKELKVNKDPLFKSISSRHTNRKKYKKDKIPNEIKAEILSSVKNYNGCSALILEEGKKIAEAAGLLSLTEKVALETSEIHRLFFGSLVWSRKEEKERGIGLYVKTLELPNFVLFLFKTLIKKWRVTNFLNRIRFSDLAAKINSFTYSSSAAMCLIVVDSLDKFSYINAGRAMQRVWLLATKYNISAQPVTGIFFFGMRIIKNDKRFFSKKHFRILDEGYKKLLGLFGVVRGTPVMNLRLGYADKPTAFSLRIEPDVEWLNS